MSITLTTLSSYVAEFHSYCLALMIDAQFGNHPS